VLGLIRSFAANAGDVVTVPEGMRFQSIDQEEVAQRLADQAGRAAAGRVPDLGGPEILTIEGMTETYLRVRGSAARVHPAPLAGALYGAFRSGVNIVPDRAVGRVTWRAFLERTSPPAR
jgi:uncharacterized protein YbjT (DUF2867 family)